MKASELLFSVSFTLTLLSVPFSASAAVVEITAMVAGCGDSVIGGGEQCDGGNLGGATCTSQGFSGGSLSCDSSCTFNTSQCTSGSPGSPGNGSVSLIEDSSKSLETQQVDIQKDGIINIFDFNLMMANWGLTQDPLLGVFNIADMNRDGAVDIYDYSTLMVFWGNSYQI